MFALYSKHTGNGVVSYNFRKKISIFGCKVGFIPRLLRTSLPAGQSEPFKWCIPVGEALAKHGYPESAIIIDINPNAKRDKYATLCELLVVWGYSHNGWTPALFHLRVILEAEDETTVNKTAFVLGRSSEPRPVYAFQRFAGSVGTGELVGRWNAPGAGPTNSALLWPEALKYFLECIAENSPELMPPADFV